MRGARGDGVARGAGARWELDARGHAGGARDAHVEVIIVRQRPAWLDHELGRAVPGREASTPDARRVGKETSSEWSRDEDVGHACVGLLA